MTNYDDGIDAIVAKHYACTIYYKNWINIGFHVISLKIQGIFEIDSERIGANYSVTGKIIRIGLNCQLFSQAF